MSTKNEPQASMLHDAIFGSIFQFSLNFNHEVIWFSITAAVPANFFSWLVLHVPVPTGEQWITLLEIPELTRRSDFLSFWSGIFIEHFFIPVFYFRNLRQFRKSERTAFFRMWRLFEFRKISRRFWERVHRGFGRLLFSALLKKAEDEKNRFRDVAGWNLEARNLIRSGEWDE